MITGLVLVSSLHLTITEAIVPLRQLDSHRNLFSSFLARDALLLSLSQTVKPA